MVALNRRLKTNENCKLSSLKVVAVAYERWSLTSGSSYSDFGILEKWSLKIERWSQGEVQLYLARNLIVSFVFIIFVVSCGEIKINK